MFLAVSLMANECTAVVAKEGAKLYTKRNQSKVKKVLNGYEWGIPTYVIAFADKPVTRMCNAKPGYAYKPEYHAYAVTMSDGTYGWINEKDIYLVKYQCRQGDECNYNEIFVDPLDLPIQVQKLIEEKAKESFVIPEIVKEKTYNSDVKTMWPILVRALAMNSIPINTLNETAGLVISEAINCPIEDAVSCTSPSYPERSCQ